MLETITKLAKRIKRTKRGYAVQVRFAGERRRQFTIEAPNDAVARQRALILSEIAQRLTRSGRLLEAPEALDTLAKSSDSFEALADEMRAWCEEPVPAEGQGYKGMTFEQFGAEFTSGRLAKKFQGNADLKLEKLSISDDISKLEVLCAIPHPVHGTVGAVPLRGFSLDDAMLAMGCLPETVKSPTTRRQYAQIMARLLKLAVFPCQARDDYPLPENFRPTPAERLDFQCLYPSDDRQLLACVEVDLGVRFLYGWAVRNGTRAGNLFEMRWQHVDLVNGFVRLPKTKTGKPLAWDLDPGCWRALAWWREQRKAEPASAYIFPRIDETKLGKRLRRDLGLAEVPRLAELLEKGQRQVPIRFHDLRASFITIALANGQSEGWITQRTGHASSQMIALYRRPLLEKLQLKDWLPLDVALGLVVGATAHTQDQQQEQEPQAKQEPHSPAPARAAEALEVEHGSDLPLGSARTALAAADDPAQGPNDVPLAGSDGQVDAGLDLLVGEAGFSQHGASERVATEVATEFGALSEASEEPLANQLVNSVGRVGLEPTTYGLKVLRETPFPAQERARDEAHAHEAPSRAPELPSALPLSSLDDDMRERLIALAVQAKQWDCVEALGRDLRVSTESRATRSNVTLLVDRRRARA